MGRNGWLERDLTGDTSARECATRLRVTAAAGTTVRDPRPAILSALAVGACLAGLPAPLLAIPLAYGVRWALALLDGRARWPLLEHRARCRRPRI